MSAAAAPTLPKLGPLNAKLRHRVPSCPYCGRAAHFSDGRELGRSAPGWVCDGYPECDAYVGCHPGTRSPLGSLANASLRAQRSSVHARLDALWRPRGAPLNRKQAYQVVATAMRRRSFHAGTAREDDIVAFEAAWPTVRDLVAQLQRERLAAPTAG